MLQQIATYTILGKPLLMYGGIFTFILLITGAIVGGMAAKAKISVRTHVLIVRIAIALALVHAILGISLFF